MPPENLLPRDSSKDKKPVNPLPHGMADTRVLEEIAQMTEADARALQQIAQADLRTADATEDIADATEDISAGIDRLVQILEAVCHKFDIILPFAEDDEEDKDGDGEIKA